MASAAAPTIELFAAVRSTNTPFLSCYGNVPPGYVGVIILPTPAGTVNAAAVDPPQEIAQVTIQSDLLALTVVAPQPLPTPSRTSLADPDPGELGTANPIPDDMDPISATKGSTDSDPRDKGKIPATKGSTPSGLGDKGSAKPDGSKLRRGKGSKYTVDEDKKIGEHVKKYFPRPVVWERLSKELGRPSRALESRWYKIRHLYPVIGVDKRPGMRSSKIGAAADTPEKETAKKTVQEPEPLNSVAAEDTPANKTAEKVQSAAAEETPEKETDKEAQVPPLKIEAAEETPEKGAG